MRNSTFGLLAGLAVCLVIAFAWLAPAARADEAHRAQDPIANAMTCEALIAAAEAQLKVPTQLLHAIAIVESGRWNSDRKRSEPWPWTLYAQGKGKRFASKADAIAEVERLQSKGIRNIDVGCMQVNLHYHGHAFNSLEEALDPLMNVAYAALYLRKLFDTTRSWTVAMARYHWNTPKHARKYRKRVLAAWREARQVAFEERRLALAEQQAERLGTRSRARQ